MSLFSKLPQLAGAVLFSFAGSPARAADVPAVAEFHQKVEPLLEHYCYQCHGDGKTNGGVAFDALQSKDAILNHDLWSKALVNLRSGLMPPQGEERPTAAAEKTVEDWVKYGAFGIDPNNPDPGRVTLRRLNRMEYRNTIRDLMGVDFNTAEELPPDDTGYGFDDIGDVLTVSPMLLEKYMAAAASIVDQAVPKTSWLIPQTTLGGSRFRPAGTESAPNNGPGPRGGRGPRGGGRGNQAESPLNLSYGKPAAVSASFKSENEGTYKLSLALSVKGPPESVPDRCRVIFKADNQELLNREFAWADKNSLPAFEFKESWQPGTHPISVEVQPLGPADGKASAMEIQFSSVTIQGPTEQTYWTRPKNFDRFFGKDPPKSASDRRQYAREIFGKFMFKAYRRPVDAKAVDRAVALAESIYQQPGKTFEEGVGHSIMAILASPRFLFRNEDSAPAKTKDAYPLVDEYSLASRLSYFLWSTMPDDELFRLAGKGELRQNLPAQIKRMLDDPRSDEMVNNFTGQWLQVRDVDGISIDTRAVRARDRGEEKQLKDALKTVLSPDPKSPPTPAEVAKATKIISVPKQIDREVRRAMERETEMVFAYIMHEDRSVDELIESDYTFLNQKLAAAYGLTNLGVEGADMRRVALPTDCTRGGVLTEGTFLVVTSNPDRTSPVKRGLFVLNNILGSPPPPPPANVPALEVAENEIHGHEPTLKETLQAHRTRPECNACHSRLDPLGLAFENFNAIGTWRNQERSQTIAPGGQLITGETFQNVRELKHILATQHRLEFYRTLVTKLLTYATGRGLEYYDTETVDQIVQRMEAGNGHFSALLDGIIASAPFQKERPHANAVLSAAPDAPKTGVVKTMNKTASAP